MENYINVLNCMWSCPVAWHTPALTVEPNGVRMAVNIFLNFRIYLWFIWTCHTSGFSPSESHREGRVQSESNPFWMIDEVALRKDFPRELVFPCTLSFQCPFYSPVIWGWRNRPIWGTVSADRISPRRQDRHCQQLQMVRLLLADDLAHLARMCSEGGKRKKGKVKLSL